jgi:hypothetical protein
LHGTDDTKTYSDRRALAKIVCCENSLRRSGGFRLQQSVTQPLSNVQLLKWRSSCDLSVQALLDLRIDAHRLPISLRLKPKAARAPRPAARIRGSSLQCDPRLIEPQLVPVVLLRCGRKRGLRAQRLLPPRDTWAALEWGGPFFVLTVVRCSVCVTLPETVVRWLCGLFLTIGHDAQARQSGYVTA